MSELEQLIQSQQVTLTGSFSDVQMALILLRLDASQLGITVTINRPSVTDAAVSVTAQSQQKSRQDGE